MIQKTKKLILWFEDIDKNDVEIVGGKNANLGEMINIGIQVPPGFSVTSNSYCEFIKQEKLDEKIFKILKSLDVNDTKKLKETSEYIRKSIISKNIPKQIESEIKKAYSLLCNKTTKNVSVAVRSSATAEDMPDASFAGQNETYLNVKEEKDLLQAVKKCFASLFTSRSIFYREQKGLLHENVYLSVAIQKMVDVKSAGVMFTLHPKTGDKSKIIIEGSWGIGESVVSGSITPDYFEINKDSLVIENKRIKDKKFELVSDIKSSKTINSIVPENRRKKSCITDNEIKKLCEIAKKIENHYGYPQDIEWALEKNTEFPDNIFIVQTRPETIWSKKETNMQQKNVEKKIVDRGLSASPGVAIGKAKIIRSLDEMSRLEKGDILVTEMTSPDWVPVMKRSSAIITEKGGVTCHAAIVSRELEIPCIVGVEDIMKNMKENEYYTVDATNGIIYYGKKIEKEHKTAVIEPHITYQFIPTATKIYMNLGIPEKIDDYKNLPLDGIGLMRIEFIISSYVKEHPLSLLERGKGEIFIDRLSDGIAKIASAIKPKPVIVRFSDFKVNEYRNLKGGEKYEKQESNPMIGFRGVSRYMSKIYKKAFALECKSIKRVREEFGLKNVWVMLPFVRTTWEVNKCLEFMKSEGLERNRDFKILLMAEVPSMAISSEEFAKLDVDGASIGSNDLCQLVLGVDRDSGILGKMGYFDERDPAVLKAMKMIIKGFKESGKPVGICGQSVSVYPEITEFLIRNGITSISVNPDTLIKTRELVAEIEKKILLGM